MFKYDKVTKFWYEKKNGNLYVRKTKHQRGRIYAILLVFEGSDHYKHLKKLYEGPNNN